MTFPQEPQLPRRRLRSILIGLVVALFVVIAAVWSYAWFQTRDIVTAKFDAFLAREVQAGRIHECGNRSIGGYPFLIEINCQSPVMRFADGSGQISVGFAWSKSAALVYAPQHIITDFGSPLVVTQNDRPVFTAAFKSAEASYRQNKNVFERFSLAVNDLQLDVPVMLSAQHIELHLRPSPSSAEAKDYDFAIQAQKLVTPGSLADQPMDFGVSSIVRGWPGWRISAETSLNQWREADGLVEVQDLRIKRNDGLLFAKGDLRLNDKHRAEGRLDATFVNGPALLRGLIMQGKNDAGALFGPLFMMLGKSTEFEGKRASTMQLKVENGVLRLGSLVLGELPPLY